MKARIFNVFAVCLVTLVVLSPGLVVIGVVWERHTELIKSQNLANEIRRTKESDRILTFPETGVSDSQYHQASIPPSERNVIDQLLTVTEQYKLVTILQWFFLLIPIGVGVGVIFYDRYLVYRTAVLKEQVEMLERLWRQSIEQ
ncbi:MAG: hypothetical protein KME21_21450 [Desmonostoc vinosum HA7617-LM4]|jgi:predicted PurR-regulated permease PerM|nr:hypothetical protein [Desmonostoc vinosum HA7617-LM4]